MNKGDFKQPQPGRDFAFAAYCLGWYEDHFRRHGCDAELAKNKALKRVNADFYKTLRRDA